MATTLQWTKGGLRLICETSKRPLPRVARAYPIPPAGTTASPLITLALEPHPTNGSEGIRVTSIPAEGLPGGDDGTVWTLRHVAYVGSAPSPLTWEDIPLGPCSSVNYLLTHAMLGATHRFHLVRTTPRRPGGPGNAGVGGTEAYPEVSIVTPTQDAFTQSVLDAQAAANGAATAAANAQTAANNAAAAAAAAQTAANTANAALADIASDGRLTPVEKQRARLEWDTILGERSGIQGQADTFGVSRTAYDSAFQTLANYLNAGTTWSSGAPSWLADVNLGTTTDISGATFRATWKALYDARQALLNAVADKARQNAAAAAALAGKTVKPSLMWDFSGASIPGSGSFPGAVASSDSGTTTTLTNTAIDQSLRLPVNIDPTKVWAVAMRVKLVTGPWEGILYPSNGMHGESASYYKVIPAPNEGEWTTIVLDMRTLDVGGTDYMTGGNITQLRFDFTQDSGTQVVVDWIAAGVFGAVSQSDVDAAQASANTANNAAAYADAMARSSHNLIKNGNSEDPNPTGWEAAWISDSGAYTGTKCRALTVEVAGGWPQETVGEAPCDPGDQFVFSAWGKQATASSKQYIFIEFLNAAGARTGINLKTFPASTAYTQVEVSGEAPAGTVKVRFVIYVDQADVTTYYWDCLYACRKISAGMLQADAIQTTNYAEDGSGNPTAGAKMSVAGTALKTSPGGLQVGSYTFTDYFWRLLQALDGSSGNRVLYRGSIDTSTRGGAPNINCLTIYWKTFGLDDASTGGHHRFQWKLQPSALSDNLDAMRYLKADLYPNAGGASATDTLYATLNDRLYANATDSNSANACMGEFTWFYRGTMRNTFFYNATPYPFYGHMLVTIYNAYGPSGQLWFHGSSSLTAGGALTADSTPPSGAPPTGGGGGGGGVGGGCPAPWVKVQLASGILVDAGALYDGAQVVGVDDITMEPKAGTVRAPHLRWVDRVAVLLEDGRSPEFSRDHRVAVVDRGWVPVQALHAGDLVMSQEPARVRSIQPAGKGLVVSFQVEGCATYFSDGLLSHNAKTPIA